MATKQASKSGEKQDAAAGSPKPEDFNAMLLAVGQNRDKDSFIRVFEYFAPRVKSFLMKNGTREETADELAQETMLAVWDKASSFDPRQASASTWIFTIARNKKIDTLRKTTRYSFESTDDNPDLETTAPSPRQTIERAEEISGIAEAIKALPEDQAQLLRKSFFEDKSHGEIAEETGIPLGTVKSRIRLALERLRKDKKVKSLW